MLSQCGMNDGAVEQDARRVGDGIEGLQGFFELVVVVVRQCLHPRLDLLSMDDRSSAVMGTIRRLGALPASTTSSLQPRWGVLRGEGGVGSVPTSSTGGRGAGRGDDDVPMSPASSPPLD